MIGCGRTHDKILIKSLWQTIKYEDIYIKDYRPVLDLQQSLEDYLWLNNYERPHQGDWVTKVQRYY